MTTSLLDDEIDEGLAKHGLRRLGFVGLGQYRVLEPYCRSCRIHWTYGTLCGCGKTYAERKAAGFKRDEEQNND
jgi:hypothetical protein